jgi:hypothetical protein
VSGGGAGKDIGICELSFSLVDLVEAVETYWKKSNIFGPSIAFLRFLLPSDPCSLALVDAHFEFVMRSIPVHIIDVEAT